MTSNPLRERHQKHPSSKQKGIVPEVMRILLLLTIVTPCSISVGSAKAEVLGRWQLDPTEHFGLFATTSALAEEARIDLFCWQKKPALGLAIFMPEPPIKGFTAEVSISMGTNASINTRPWIRGGSVRESYLSPQDSNEVFEPLLAWLSESGTDEEDKIEIAVTGDNDRTYRALFQIRGLEEALSVMRHSCRKERGQLFGG